MEKNKTYKRIFKLYITQPKGEVNTEGVFFHLTLIASDNFFHPILKSYYYVIQSHYWGKPPCLGWASNLRPTAYRSGALPLVLPRQVQKLEYLM